MPACLQGDARERAAYEALLQGRPVDLLLTDPPYCLLTRRRKGGDLRDPHARKIDRDPVLRFEDVKAYRRFTEAWVPLALGALKPEGVAVIWTNVLGKPPLLEAAAKAGFTHLWGEFIWAKRTKEVNASEQLLRVYETALVLARRPAPALTAASLPQVWAAVTGYDDEGEGKEWGRPPAPQALLQPRAAAAGVLEARRRGARPLLGLGLHPGGGAAASARGVRPGAQGRLGGEGGRAAGRAGRRDGCSKVVDPTGR